MATNKKTCLLGGAFNFDTIVERKYPDGFVVGKNNKFVEHTLSECVGGTCGNVSCMLPYLGVQTFPLAHFDESEQGLQMKEDLRRYGADVRFVQNSPKGGTTLLRCTHKLDKATGKPATTFRATSPGSRFAKRKAPRGRDEAPEFLQTLDFTPDVFFFDMAESGYRVIAEGLRQKGTLIYFEPESDKEQSKFIDAVKKSDIIKFSGEKVTDLSFCDGFSDKIFVQTRGAEGLLFKLGRGEWQKVAPVPNDNVVDWEGAGDWTTSQFIACLCERNILSFSKMTEQNICECLEAACQTASRSVSFMGSKGMID